MRTVKLVQLDGKFFPNLALMKIAHHHRSQGDQVFPDPLPPTRTIRAQGLRQGLRLRGLQKIQAPRSRNFGTPIPTP